MATLASDQEVYLFNPLQCWFIYLPAFCKDVERPPIWRGRPSLQPHPNLRRLGQAPRGSSSIRNLRRGKRYVTSGGSLSLAMTAARPCGKAKYFTMIFSAPLRPLPRAVIKGIYNHPFDTTSFVRSEGESCYGARGAVIAMPPEWLLDIRFLVLDIWSGERVGIGGVDRRGRSRYR